jgi:hypothetical protein
MNDQNVHQHIEELVAEEHALFDKASDGGLSAHDKVRLEEIQVQLDRFYDLLRQRRAREEFGQNPDATHLRSEKTVEGYLQ